MRVAHQDLQDQLALVARQASQDHAVNRDLRDPWDRRDHRALQDSQVSRAHAATQAYLAHQAKEVHPDVLVSKAPLGCRVHRDHQAPSAVLALPDPW